MIVLICADWVPTFHWCVLPATSGRLHGRAAKRALAGNVNVHGPAARSLTTAATTGGVSKNKSVEGDSLYCGLRSGAGGEDQFERRPSGFRQRHLSEEIPDETTKLPRQRHVHLGLHDSAVEQMPAAFVQPHLGFPSELPVARRLSSLPQRERSGYFRWMITLMGFAPIGLALIAHALP